MIIFLILAVVAIGLALLRIKFKKIYSYWSDQGVRHPPPEYLFGNVRSFLFRTDSITGLLQKIYEAFPGGRYVGLYSFVRPVVLIKDPDLIKQLTVNDFDHFVDHRQFVPEDVDPVWSKSLFSLRGQKWRDMRTTLSPCFTGSKMRQIFSLLNESSQNFVNYFQEHPEETESLEMKDTLSRYATDVIATTAFGIKVDSLQEKDNEFFKMGQELTSFTKLSKILTFFGYAAFPNILKQFGVKLFSTSITNFFKTIVHDTIKEREGKMIKRPDLIHILMEAKKGGLTHEVEDSNGAEDASFAVVEESQSNKAHKGKVAITDEEIAAQAMVFFFGGFDTVSTCMTFMAYELAINIEIQQKLQEEIDECLRECNGKLTYDIVMKMKYLDMVVSESLRKWPPVTRTDRVCTKPYTIQPVGPNETPAKIMVDHLVWLPIYSLHRDPQFYPDPDRFDPERFSEENKSSIVPYAYLPFGTGPRNCIGSRMAILEVKTLFVHLLSKFNVVVSGKTDIPVRISKKQITLQAENGMWLKFKARRSTD